MFPGRLQSRPRSLPCALRQVVLIESLPDQGLDDGLAAHVEVAGGPVQFLAPMNPVSEYEPEKLGKLTRLHNFRPRSVILTLQACQGACV